MTAVIDYGVGNLFSLLSSLGAVGEQAVVTDDPAVIHRAARLILPGVGAFADAAHKLRDRGLDAAVCREAARGKPLLGICLGMQLLFQRSWEFGVHRGLGLIEGDILPFSAVLSEAYKIPHIGWNTLEPRRDCPLFGNAQQGGHVYFVHSYYAPGDCPDAAALTEYGVSFASAVGRGNVYGVQFHPEKSGPVGLDILRRFAALGGEA